MDKYLTNDEERLFDLIEHTDADQLTADERAFVERHLTLAEYALQHRLVVEAAFVSDPVPEPAPLAIAAPPANRITGKTVPLYQAIAAVAATVALFLSLWPDQSAPTQVGESGTRLSKTDTIYRTKIIVDTVIRYIERREKHYAEHMPDRQPDAMVQSAQLRILEAGPIPLPELTEELIRTKGSSLKDDEETGGVLNSVYQSTVW